MLVERSLITMPKLSVPYISQKDQETNERYGRRGCGLTALRMVLAYYGVELSLAQLEEIIEKTQAYSEEIGWIHAGMVNMARGLGLNGYRINYIMLSEQDIQNARAVLSKEGAEGGEISQFEQSFNYAKENSPLADICRLIDQQIPIIASMERSYANTLATHMVVLTGYDSENFTANDPWNFGENHQISKKNFEQHWTKRAVIIFKNP